MGIEPDRITRVCDPSDLPEKICSAARVLERVTGEPIAELLRDDFNELFCDDEDAGGPLTLDTDVVLSLPRIEDCCDTTVGGFLRLAEELSTASIVDKHRYYSQNRAIVRTEPRYATDKAFYIIEAAVHGNDCRGGAVEFAWAGSICRCQLVSGITPYAFLATGSFAWDKHHPAINYEEVFVEVTWDAAIPRCDIDLLVDSYLFEVAVGWGVTLIPCPRHEPIVVDSEIDPELPPLRPPALVKHAQPVFKAYVEASASYDDSIAVLLYAKVFEYVSYTVVRQQLVARARSKLLSPEALQPTADFVYSLEGVFSDYRAYRKDREAIQLTVQQACDADALASDAPACLRELSVISLSSSAKDRDSALKAFAGCLVDTRNQIAHAKSNYEPTGSECPPEQLVDFRRCVARAAQQAVRWFADLGPAVVEGAS